MAPPESHQRIIGYNRRSKGSSYEDHKNRCKHTPFHNCTSIFIFVLCFYDVSTIKSNLIPRVWRDPLRTPAGVGKQKNAGV